MIRMRATDALVLGVALAASGCAGASTSNFEDAGATGSHSDSGHAGDSSAGNAVCPHSTQGPLMVSVGKFCIDSTEVTKAQYQQFLSAGYRLSSQPSYCAWNQSYVPTGQWPPTAMTDAQPVTSVDWCDAHAYCTWAGKRLCGQIGGGPVSPSNAYNPAADQWFFSCSEDGQRAYPYGNTYGATTCNGNGANGGAQIVEAVKSFPKCVGGFPGIFDMSGNVREWEDSCDGAGGANDPCNQRGGSVNLGADQLTCAADDLEARNSSNDHLGFRCCAP
jgi:formylglycine-generating enzyme required for sulfatase activity